MLEETCSLKKAKGKTRGGRVYSRILNFMAIAIY